MKIAVVTPEELQKVVDAVQAMIGEGTRIFLLSGDLGSGKTSFVQAFGRFAQIDVPASSPTFSLVHAYESPAHGTIYHMDLYRLERQQDLDQIGFDEYIDSGRICFIEWPDLAMPRLPFPYVQILIEWGQNNIRIFNITTHDAVDA